VNAGMAGAMFGILLPSQTAFFNQHLLCNVLRLKNPSCVIQGAVSSSPVRHSVDDRLKMWLFEIGRGVTSAAASHKH